MIKAQIITIGDEILIGQVMDSNSGWLASELTKLGFQVSSILSISDNAKQITDSINHGFENNDLLILTGGLGPTKDDITKNTLCTLYNTYLEHNDDVYSDVESFLRQRGSSMNRLNKDQALFPKGAWLLRNNQGTAPGIWFNNQNKVLISLPGVPWEMKGIFSQEASKKLAKTFKLSNNYYQTVMITGIGESPLALKLEKWEELLPSEIKVAYLPSPGLIRLRLGIIGKLPEESKVIIGKYVKKLHDIIPEYIISDVEVTLQELIVNTFKNNNKSLSIAESCTGGNIATLISSVPGCSTAFKGAVVAYSNEVKTNILNIDARIIEEFGAVSKQVAECMAIGVRNQLNSNYSVATTGIAGPDGGTKEKPVGTVWIAVSGSQGVKSAKFTFGNERNINIQRSSIAALNMLYEFISK